MGPIQSSLNQLTLSLIGAVGGLAKGVKGGFIQPKKETNEPEEQKPLEPAEISDYKVQSPIEYTKPLPEEVGTLMSDYAAISGNDLIRQKARARFKTVEERKASFKEGQNLQEKLAEIRKRKMRGGSK